MRAKKRFWDLPCPGPQTHHCLRNLILTTRVHTTERLIRLTEQQRLANICPKQTCEQLTLALELGPTTELVPLTTLLQLAVSSGGDTSRPLPEQKRHEVLSVVD